MPRCARVLPQVFTPKATKNDTKLDGQLAAKYVFGGGMESEVTLATSGVLKGSFEAANVIAKGLVVKMECETPAPGKSGLLSSGLTDVNYKTGPFDCKASYDFYKGDLTGAPAPQPLLPPPRAARSDEGERPHSCAASRCAASPSHCCAVSSCAASRCSPRHPAAPQPLLSVERGACAAACASGTFSGVTLGAECGYSTTKSALSKYAAACQYVQPDFTVSAKMAEVMKTPGSVFSGAYYHKVSSEMQVGAEIKKAATKSDVDLAFGCTYKLDKSTTVKGKVRTPPAHTCTLPTSLPSRPRRVARCLAVIPCPPHRLHRSCCLHNLRRLHRGASVASTASAASASPPGAYNSAHLFLRHPIPPRRKLPVARPGLTLTLTLTLTRSTRTASSSPASSSSSRR